MNTAREVAPVEPELQDADQVSQLFLALAHPTRVRILNLLAAGSLCVCDVVELLDEPQPTVSRHLGSLREHRLVDVTRRGRFAHYRLSMTDDDLRATLLRCLRRILEQAPELARERRRGRSRVAARAADPCQE